MRTLDVLVPSFRLDAECLLSILALRSPVNWQVRWIIVADDPACPVPPEVATCVDDAVVRLIRNPHNLGSAASRNAALDASTAHWVLFLDDDVIPDEELLKKYCKAVDQHQRALGFFGPTSFSPATTHYQRGVEVSDILTFFRIARTCESLLWAPTSNVLIRGDAARAERFRTAFPKGGGGEDIDYLLRVSQRAGGTLLAVPDASVFHPWWFGGKRDYTRFMRWSYGDSLLHDLHPQFTYRAAPNAIEVLACGLPFCALAAFNSLSILPLFAMLFGVVCGEVFSEFIRLSLLKGFREAFYCIETILIRSSNDLGRLAMQLKLKRLRGITERWDHFCDGEHVPYHQRWSLIKFTAFCVCTALSYWILDANHGMS